MQISAVNAFEVASAGLGVLQGILVMFNLRCSWVAYVAQMLCMLAFSLMSRLYGDALNSTVYIVAGISGYMVWGSRARRITVSSHRQTLAMLALFAGVSAVLYCALKDTDDPLPMIDSMTTVSSFIATWLMVVRRLDTWVWWFCNDLMYVATYYLLPDQAWWLLSLNAGWTVMAVLSYVNWRKELKEYR